MTGYIKKPFKKLLPEQCGNYLDQNLPMARFLAKRFFEETLMHFSEDRYTYTPLA